MKTRNDQQPFSATKEKFCARNSVFGLLPTFTEKNVKDKRLFYFGGGKLRQK